MFDVEAIREFARSILTPYKVPRRIFVVDELPQISDRKVLRREVKDQAGVVDDRGVRTTSQAPSGRRALPLGSGPLKMQC